MEPFSPETDRLKSAICALNRKFFDDRELSKAAWFEAVTDDLVPRNPKQLRTFILEELEARSCFNEILGLLLVRWEMTNWKTCSVDRLLAVPVTLPEPDRTFYPFRLLPGVVAFVDSKISFNDCISCLHKTDVIGIDGEWRPELVRMPVCEKPSRLSILQLSTRSRCYILDFLTLRNVLSQQDWQNLLDVFHLPHVLKLGFAIQGDFHRMKDVSDRFVFSFDPPSDYPNLFDLKVLSERLASTHPQIFGKRTSGEIRFNLSNVVDLLFGQPLDKREQLSNWENRPLRENQIQYAALDAFCLIEIYDTLLRVCTEKCIPFPPEPLPVHEPVLEMDVASFPLINQDQPILSTKLRLTCDNTFRGLARRLRNLGIDATFVEDTWSEQYMYNSIIEEDRIFLTVPTRLKVARRHLPPGSCFAVSNMATSVVQLQYVVRMLNIYIEKDALFSRCSCCNGGSFIRANDEQLRGMLYYRGKSVVSEKNVLSPDPDAKDVDDMGKDFWRCFKQLAEFADAVDSNTGVIAAGDIMVDLDSIRQNVLERVKDYFICGRCGKIYWHGSHFRRTWGFLISNNIVS